MLKTFSTALNRAYKIYTRTGDRGTAALANGERHSKSSHYFDALGNIDELNSHIGFATSLCKQSKLNQLYYQQLGTIQNTLFDIGSSIALCTKLKFSKQHSTNLENWIDEMDKSLTPLTYFILPSGSQASSYIHVCRSACRRAERSLVPLLEQSKIENDAFAYVNRLSDYLFTLSRLIAKCDGIQETRWVNTK